MADALQIGIVGTFDLQNYGDLLFPLIAEAELTKRLGAIKIRPFAYAARSPPEWPFEVTSVADLPELVGGLDAMLIGGGHVVRFDKSIAPNYAPPNSDIHHPGGYWLMPALMAQQHGVPVIWNAVGAHGSTPAWAEPLLRGALGDSAYIAVRDSDAFNSLASLVNCKTINIVPDTCFGVSRVVDDAPSAEHAAIRGALGLNEPYIVVQATSGLDGFGQFLRDHRDRLSVKRLVAVPIGPVLGDSNALVSGFDGLTTLSHWPSPLVIAELIGRARAVVGTSMHLAITALSFGIPVFRPAGAPGKYAVLSEHDGVFSFPPADAIDLHWFEASLHRKGDAKAVANMLALERYWDHVASIVKAPREANRHEHSVLRTLVQRLPGMLEDRAEREAHLAEAQQNEREFAARLAIAQEEGVRLESRLGAAEEEGRELTARLATAETRLAELRDEAVRTERRLAAAQEEEQRLEVFATDLTNRVHARDLRIASLKSQSNADRSYIAAVHNSTSWRVTAPIRWAKTQLNGLAGEKGSILDFSAIANQELKRQPYDWAFANSVFSNKDARALAQNYPHDQFKTVKGYDGEKGYEYEARALIHMGRTEIAFADGLSPEWRRLAHDLLAPRYREAVSELTGRDLMTAPMEAYVCHFGAGAWLGPHVDLRDKIMTHVFYFNEAWNPNDGGCLNILGSKDMDDQVAEVLPIVGNTSVLVRSDTSWHAVSKVKPGTPSRRSMNVIFFREGAVSTMWPPGETPALHEFRPA